ncbi:MAG: SRPBCC domain-containing protein [Gammaproteobacteria bacterium]
MTEPQLTVGADNLSITHTFDATAERLFQCFTDAALLSKWHAPGEMQVSAEVDLRVGGEYRIAMKNAEGQVFTAVGAYKEIDAPNKLVYTWSWAERDLPETVVTVLFTRRGEQTTVDLIHEGFPTAEEAQHHSQGWTGIYMNLAGFLNNS